METATRLEQIEQVQTEKPTATHFECAAPDNYKVFVAGTFNGWDPKSIPMINDGEGNWEVDVPLSPGRYEFKFVVDDKWCCDPGCGCNGPDHCVHKCVPNDFGTMNRILEVS